MCILVHKVGRDQNFKGQCLERPDDAQCQVLKLVNFFKKSLKNRRKVPFYKCLTFIESFSFTVFVLLHTVMRKVDENFKKFRI